MSIENKAVIKYQVDKTGRLNPSTTDMARTREFRGRVLQGRMAAGLSSTFSIDPQGVYESAVEANILNRLTPLEREVLDLRFKSGLSQADTAAQLGRKPRAVSKIERYALGKLQGYEARAAAESALKEGRVSFLKATFLTPLERQVAQLLYVDGLSLSKTAVRLGYDIRRMHEIKKAVIYKFAQLYDFNE